VTDECNVCGTDLAFQGAVEAALRRERDEAVAQRDALKAALEEIVKVESQSWESIAVYAQNIARQALKKLEEK